MVRSRPFTSSHKCEVVKSFLASEKVKVLNHPLYSLKWVPVTSFYFQGLRKCFLEISIRLEVLLAALFVSVSNRYQKKTISQRAHDINTTSPQRRCVMTLHRRWDDVVFTSCACRVICFSQLGKKVTKMCCSKGGMVWRFVIKICLIKYSTEVIRTQWQNFLQDPRNIDNHSTSPWWLYCWCLWYLTWL